MSNIEQQNKENILDLIIYLFEKYAENKYQENIEYEKLRQDVINAGFNNEDLNKASDWLCGLFSQQKNMEKNPPQQNSVHIFTAEECSKINKECRNLIFRLESEKMLTPITRELVISRLMELEPPKVNIEQAKLVVVMVLSNQQDQHYALACVEKLVLNNYFENVE